MSQKQTCIISEELRLELTKIWNNVHKSTNGSKIIRGGTIPELPPELPPELSCIITKKLSADDVLSLLKSSKLLNSILQVQQPKLSIQLKNYIIFLKNILQEEQAIWIQSKIDVSNLTDIISKFNTIFSKEFTELNIKISPWFDDGVEFSFSTTATAISPIERYTITIKNINDLQKPDKTENITVFYSGNNHTDNDLINKIKPNILLLLENTSFSVSSVIIHKVIPTRSGGFTYDTEPLTIDILKQKLIDILNKNESKNKEKIKRFVDALVKKIVTPVQTTVQALAQAPVPAQETEQVTTQLAIMQLYAVPVVIGHTEATQTLRQKGTDELLELIKSSGYSLEITPLGQIVKTDKKDNPVGGNSVKEYINILGRKRIVVKQGNKKFVNVNKSLITLAEAKKLDKNKK